MIANWSLGAGEADYDPYRAGGNAALGGLDEWSQLIAEFTSPAYAPTRSAGDAGSGGGSVPLSFAKKGVLTLATLTRKRLTGPDALDPLNGTNGDASATNGAGANLWGWLALGLGVVAIAIVLRG